MAVTEKFSAWLRQHNVAETRHQSIAEGCEAIHKALCFLDKENLRNACDNIGIENLINGWAHFEGLRKIQFSQHPSVEDNNGSVKELIDYIYTLEEQEQFSNMNIAKSTVLFDKICKVKASM